MAARSQKNAGKLWHPRVKVMMKCRFKSSALLRKKSKKKTTINTLDVSAEEIDYQKKLKWLKDHGELTGEEGNNPGEESFF
jgi:phosphoserine aminotransferase